QPVLGAADPGQLGGVELRRDARVRPVEHRPQPLQRGVRDRAGAAADEVPVRRAGRRRVEPDGADLLDVELHGLPLRRPDRGAGSARRSVRLCTACHGAGVSGGTARPPCARLRRARSARSVIPALAARPTWTATAMRTRRTSSATAAATGPAMATARTAAAMR